ncbi:MAG: HPP family protein [Gammaproteobacteria bacterium]|nr:HPP family protein [Gammaproteobacteria bacterium]
MSLPPYLSRWLPAQNELSAKSILLSSLSALIAIGLVGLASRYTLTGYNIVFIAASMGASAVLLFVVPTSPLAQPWPFVGGHLISALLGVCCAKWIPDLAIAGSVAVGSSIFAMHYLRCMHPPGGAAALFAVMGGDSVHAMGFQFLLSPILLNVSIMLVCAFIYWRLAGIHQHQVTTDGISLDKNWARTEEDWLVANTPFSDENLNQAIAKMDTFIDISRQDLKEIYAHALQHSQTHNLGDIRCHEAMHSPVIRVEYGAELDTVWQIFEQNNIRGVPVVDNYERVVGIVTVSNFVHNADQLTTGNQQETSSSQHKMAEQLALLRKRTPGFESDKPEVAGQIMSSPVITAQENDRLADLAPIFTQHAIHHLPVVNDKRKLVGMLTREDILAARSN